jgi:putative endonuclease
VFLNKIIGVSRDHLACLSGGGRVGKLAYLRRPVLDTGQGFLPIERMQKGGWVYIMADRYRGGMYTGVTANLPRRVYEHKSGIGSDHVRESGKTMLVYAERHEDIADAIAREKLIKKWRRAWKFDLIEKDNPDWKDLWLEWYDTKNK